MSTKIDFETLLPGTVATVTQGRNRYFRLTWKENGTTVTRYIRLDEIKRVRLGVAAYRKAHRIIDRAAQKNLKALIRERE